MISCCSAATPSSFVLSGFSMSKCAPARAAVAEEFITGDEHSFEVVSVAGKPVWHSLTRYDPPPLDVLRNPWIQWTVLLPREIEAPQLA